MTAGEIAAHFVEVYGTSVSKDAISKGTGQTRWGTRWKPALNAFASTFADRMPTASTHQ